MLINAVAEVKKLICCFSFLVFKLHLLFSASVKLFFYPGVEINHKLSGLKNVCCCFHCSLQILRLIIPLFSYKFATKPSTPAWILCTLLLGGVCRLWVVTIGSPESYTIGNSFPPQPTAVTLLFHSQTFRVDNGVSVPILDQ